MLKFIAGIVITLALASCSVGAPAQPAPTSSTHLSSIQQQMAEKGYASIGQPADGHWQNPKKGDFVVVTRNDEVESIEFSRDGVVYVCSLNLAATPDWEKMARNLNGKNAAELVKAGCTK